MHDLSTQIPCPSCGAPLDTRGHCAHCGNQARGFWQDLDLGAPELAAAVVEGLDYYLLLDAAPTASAVMLVDAYRRRRQLYPDDPSRLHPQLARQLGLLEEAWRILGVAERRALYDRLRATRAAGGTGAQSAVRALSCPACGASTPRGAAFCPACGAAQVVEATAAPDLPIDQLPNYYETLGVSPRLVAPAPTLWNAQARRGRVGLLDLLTGDLDDDEPGGVRIVPPSDDEIRLAYLQRQKELLLRNDPEAETAVEVALRVLSDPRRRAAYDRLLAELRERGWTAPRMQALSALDREVRAELAGGVAADGPALLQQGKGLLKLNLPQQAAPVLQRAAQSLPDSPEAQYTYGLALWRSADLMSFTGHQLRQGIAAFEAAARLDARLAPIVAPYVGVWRGLQHYNDGEIEAALAEFQGTARAHPTSVAAWRMCAAVALRQRDPEAALDACRRALALEPEHEPVLLLAIAACWQQRRPDEARTLAERVAQLRGGRASVAGMLAELGLS